MRKNLQFALVGVYLILVGLGFYLLATSQTGAHLVSPWQTIRHSYIYVFGLATLILGILIWRLDLTSRPSPRGEGTEAPLPSPLRRGAEGEVSPLKIKIIIACLVVHSFLLHSYLPLTHKLLYGADQWRHIASEMRIVQGLPFKDAATGSTSSLSSFVGQISYSSLWYISIAKAYGIQQFTRWDTLTSLIFVSKWLQVVWWSLTVPILLYFLGKVLGWSSKQSMLLSWLGFLPFPFQYGGAVLVPVHFGFPVFLLGIILLLQRLKSDDKKWLKWLLFVGALSLFGYLLYAGLFWVGWLVCEVLRVGAGFPRPGSARRMVRAGKPRPYVLVFVSLLCIMVLPTLEFAGHYTSLKSSIFSLQTIKTIFTNFTLLDLARGTNVDYLNGNIIFNQVPSYAFVSNIFTVWQWWIPAFIIVFWFICMLGVRVLWKRNDAVGKYLVIFGGGLFVNYIVSRYFLAGEQILTRRLDTTLALFFLVYFASGLISLAKNTPPFIPPLKGEGQGVGLFLVIFFMSIAITVSYSLGPDTMVVSSGEFAAAKSVWSEWQAHKIEYERPCVAANTNTLLALEAISSKDIVGGGFPINSLFAQPELASLYKTMTTNLSTQSWQNAMSVTGAKGCWFVTKNDVGYNVVVRYSSP